MSYRNWFVVVSSRVVQYTSAVTVCEMYVKLHTSVPLCTLLFLSLALEQWKWALIFKNRYPHSHFPLWIFSIQLSDMFYESSYCFSLLHRLSSGQSGVPFLFGGGMHDKPKVVSVKEGSYCLWSLTIFGTYLWYSNVELWE